MKYTYLILLMIATVTFSACTPEVSDSDLQTAIAQAVETSSADVAPTETQLARVSTADAELKQVQDQLHASNLVLTTQANQLAAMQEQLDQIQLALTPTITPTPAATSTSTPLSTATASLLPDDQKLVYATRQAPLHTYTEKNDKGYPIMIKTDPIIRYAEGDWIIVFSAPVQADGSTLFYKVVSPYGEGKYINITHVRDH
jgi:hypothetical protein